MRIVLVAFLLTGCLGPSLFVDKAGDGEGTIISDPDGIACGDACGTLASGLVTLTAEPSVSSHFISWDGACTGRESCTVEVVANTMVTAKFELKTYELALTSTAGGHIEWGPAGISCADECPEPVRHGTRVELVAVPDPGYTFVQWTWPECFTQRTCAFTMTGDRAVGAEFARDNVLTVSRAGTGGGLVRSAPSVIECGPTCTATLGAGETVLLFAEPDPMSMFKGWSGACTGLGECMVAMTENRHVTASFGPREYPILTVTITGTGTGTVTSTPSGIACPHACKTQFASGAVVTLTAQPQSGGFTGWSGSGCTGTGTCTVTVNGATAVTATFGSP